MNIDEIISQRKSHYPKEFNGQEVEEILVQRMLVNAGFAPNHKSTKPWRFKVFNKAEIPALCNKILALYFENTSEEMREENKINKIKKLPLQLSHAIAIGISFSGKVPAWEEIAATGAAVQNMYLTLVPEAHAAGYWTTGNGTGTAAMRDFCGWEETVVHHGFFFLGMVEEKRR